MSTDLTAFKAAGLPAVDMGKFKQALGPAAQAARAAAAGMILLRLLKDSRWVYGSDDVEVQPGSLWAINPFSMSMGWAAWGDERGPNKGKLMGERMALITETQFAFGDLPNVGEEWSAQVQFDLVCVSDEDIGTVVRYKTTSVGGRRAFAGILQEVSEHADGDGMIVPVVDLKTDNYKHKIHGLIYVPVFELVEWRAPDDTRPVNEAADDQAAETTQTDAPAEQEKPSSSRRAPAARAGAQESTPAATTTRRAAGTRASAATQAGAATPGGPGTVDRGAVVRRRRSS